MALPRHNIAHTNSLNTIIVLNILLILGWVGILFFALNKIPIKQQKLKRGDMRGPTKR